MGKEPKDENSTANAALGNLKVKNLSGSKGTCGSENTCSEEILRQTKKVYNLGEIQPGDRVVGHERVAHSVHACHVYYKKINLKAELGESELGRGDFRWARVSWEGE